MDSHKSTNRTLLTSKSRLHVGCRAATCIESVEFCKSAVAFNKSTISPATSICRALRVNFHLSSAYRILQILQIAALHPTCIDDCDFLMLNTIDLRAMWTGFRFQTNHAKSSIPPVLKYSNGVHSLHVCDHRHAIRMQVRVYRWAFGSNLPIRLLTKRPQIMNLHMSFESLWSAYQKISFSSPR